VEDKKTLDKLDKVTQQLKAISEKLSVAFGVDTKGGASKVKKTLTPEELAKVKITAAETAKVYKNILGLGFNQKDVDNTANRFRVILGITPFFNSFQKNFEAIKTYIQNSASNKNKLEIKDQIKIKDLENLFNKKRLFENTLVSNLNNLNKTSLDTYDFIKKNQTNESILTELQKISNSNENISKVNNLDQNILTELQKISNNTESSFRFATADSSNKDIIDALGNLSNVLGTRKPKNYTNSLKEIKTTLTTISNTLQSKIYEPLMNSLLLKIEELKGSFDNKIGKLKVSSTEYVRSVNAFKKLLGWDELRYAILDYVDTSAMESHHLNSNIEKLVSINDEMRNKMGDKKPKLDSGGSWMGKLGNVAILATLGVGLFLIVNALLKSGSIDVAQTLKVLVILGAFVGLFVLVGKAGAGIKNASIGFAILAATMLFLVLPLMDKVGKMDYGVIIEGLIKMSIIIGSCIGLMVLMNFIKANEVIKSSAGLGLLVLVIGFLLIPFLFIFKISPYTKGISGFSLRISENINEHLTLI
jgi:hypothetical protein